MLLYCSIETLDFLVLIQNEIKLGQNFLLVDLLGKKIRFRVGGTKKINKKALKKNNS